MFGFSSSLIPLPVWLILAVFSFFALHSRGESMCKCFVAPLNRGSPSSPSMPVLPGTAEFSLGALPAPSSPLTSGQQLPLRCEHCQRSRPWKRTLIPPFSWWQGPWFWVCWWSMCPPCLWPLLKLGVGAAWQRLLLGDFWAQEPFLANVVRTEQAVVTLDSSICCMKCKNLPEEVPFQLLTVVLLCNYSFGWKIPVFWRLTQMQLCQELHYLENNKTPMNIQSPGEIERWAYCWKQSESY